MLRLQTILLLFAGAALAHPRTAWNNGKDYTYKVSSRTLAAFDQKLNQYTGILIEGDLTIQPNGQNILRAKMSKPRYSQIHTYLEKGWDSEIPEDRLNHQNLPLSGKPFEIQMKNGVVKDLVVDKDTPTWEVNILKSIISQLQVDTQGENAMKSKRNHLPEGEHPFALFKTMEDSVTGKCEVLYDVSPLPQHALQQKPELAPMPYLEEEGDLILVVKTKNYSNCEQRVSYHYGINQENRWEPGNNENGKYLTRSSVSRIVVTGSLKKYTIQSSVTTNKVLHGADSQDNAQGMVVSKMNLTLYQVKDMSEEIPAPYNPESVGNLVYNYNNPFGSSSSRRPNRLNKDEENKHDRAKNSDESLMHSSSSDASDSMYDNDENNYLQPRPKLTEPPQNPMLPLFIGNSGNSVLSNNKIDAVKSSKDMAQQIGNEMQNPDNMLDEQTLEKFVILSRLIRAMNAEKIAEVQRSLYEQPQSWNQLNQVNQAQMARRNAWVAFRDAVAQAGTGPALVNIKQWIQNKQIQGMEAAHVIDMAAKSTRTPTPEYMDAFFEMVTMPETKKQPIIQDSAVLSLADLIRHAVVNKRNAHNNYPVHVFGKFFSKNNHNLHDKYIPYMADELKSAIKSGDSRRIQVYTTALGKTGHPRILSFFEPYIEGRKQVSPFQRLVMVLSLDKLAETHPKVARSVLYKIYSNSADDYEIRVAAVYLLMKTNPSASMLQRMAEYTNYDSNKHVNSAVKSTIEWLAKLDNENRELSNAARAAQPLLTSENYGPQYSRAFFMNFKNALGQTRLSLESNYIGSDDTIVPKGVYISGSPTFKSMKLPSIELGGTISSWQDLGNFVQQKLMNSKNNKKNNEKAQQKKFSPENIGKLLGIFGNNPEQLEGFAFVNGLYGNNFITFDNHTLENIPEHMKQLFENMKNGRNFDETRLNNHEVTVSFPMDTGFPFHYTFKAPVFMNINGNAQLKASNKQSSAYKSVTASGKVRFVYAIEIQKRLGFTTPFEHQQYMVGVDKNMQLHVPIRSEIEYDMDKQEARIKVQTNEDDKEFKVLQYKTQPFTSKRDILSLVPVSKDANTHIIHKDRIKANQIELLDQGLKFNWERLTERSKNENEDFGYILDDSLNSLSKMAKSISTLYYPNAVDAEYQKYSIELLPNNDMSVEMKVSYDSLTTDANNTAYDAKNWSPKAKASHLEKSLNEKERKQKLLREASKDINAATADAIDVSLQLNGGVQASMVITAAVASSNVDEKSRGLLYVSVDDVDDLKYHIAVGVENKIPNIESLDHEETLKANTPQDYDVVIHFSDDDKTNNEQHKQIRIHIQAKQTAECKNEVRQSRAARECTKQVNQNGNKMTPICQKVNERAAMIDSAEVVVDFENLSGFEQLAQYGIDLVEAEMDSVSDINKEREDKEEDHKIRVAFKLSSNNRKLDVSVKTSEGRIGFNNVQVDFDESRENSDETDRKIEPTFDIKDTCSLDKTQVITFDNHRYPLELGQCWHVAMTTYQKNDPDRLNQVLPIPENMHISILTKENENDRKDLKITIGDKEIELSESSPKTIAAMVNGQKVHCSAQQTYQEKEDGEVIYELFELPDKSVKLVSDKYDVEIIYDGNRARIQVGEQYRDAIRGLCGNMDSEPANDQQTPRGCLVKEPKYFSAQYALTNDQCQGPAHENSEKAKMAECHFQTTRSGNVISDQEAGRQSDQSNKHDGDNEHGKHCTNHRTLVTKTDNEICFSLRPVPNCSSKCRTTGTKTKNIQFHCVPRNTAAEKAAQRIEKGANPDLSQKSVSKSESLQIPISCEP